MSDKEMALIARIVKTGEMEAALEFGITVDDFLSAETKQLWNVLHSYHLNPVTSGSVIDEALMREQFTNFMIPDDTWLFMTTQALCHEVRLKRMKAQGLYAAHEFSKAVAGGGDLTQAFSAHAAQIQALLALGVSGNTDVEMHSAIDSHLHKVDLMRQGVNLSVMSWPWDALQDATLGVQKEDYVVFYGRPKSMKTWVLCYLLAWAFMQEKRVLVYTKEMTPDQLFLRIACCICNLPYDEARKGRITAEEEAALRHVREMNAYPLYGGQIIALNAKDTPPGGDNVSWLRGKIKKYKPSLMFIDGLYLISEESGKRSRDDSQRVMSISRSLRDMVLGTGVPVIATMQANRKAASHGQANLDEVAYSDALSQDATLIARVIADKTTPEKPTQTVSIVIGGAREFKLHGFRIHGVPAVDFTQHSVLTEKDIEKAKEGDMSDAESKTTKAKKKGENGSALRTPVTEGTEGKTKAALAVMGYNPAIINGAAQPS